jgi:hypothetical protein
MGILRFLCLLIVSAAFANRATYHNYQVHRVVPENQEQLNILKDLVDDPNGVRMLCQEVVFIVNTRKVVDVMLFTNRRCIPLHRNCLVHVYIAISATRHRVITRLIKIRNKIKHYHKLNIDLISLY